MNQVMFWSLDRAAGPTSQAERTVFYARDGRAFHQAGGLWQAADDCFRGQPDRDTDGHDRHCPYQSERRERAIK